MDSFRPALSVSDRPRTASVDHFRQTSALPNGNTTRMPLLQRCLPPFMRAKRHSVAGPVRSSTTATTTTAPNSPGEATETGKPDKADGVQDQTLAARQVALPSAKDDTPTTSTAAASVDVRSSKELGPRGESLVSAPRSPTIEPREPYVPSPRAEDLVVESAQGIDAVPELESDVNDVINVDLASSEKVFAKFASRRSVVHSTTGIVACTQPLAAQCGLEVLRKGGNAADAAVAVAAGLNVTEPCSTGIGGDMFLLYRDAATGTISALNGSGRSGAKYTLDRVREHFGLGLGDSNRPAAASRRPPVTRIPASSILSATVPGAAAGWVDTVERFGSGKVSMDDVLAPAIRLAESGFPVSEITGRYWQSVEPALRIASSNFRELLKRDPTAPDGYRAPGPGEVMRNPTLAETFRTLAREGKRGFYMGRIAAEIVHLVRQRGGWLEMDDLADHLRKGGSEGGDPISVVFRGQGVCEKIAEEKKRASGKQPSTDALSEAEGQKGPKGQSAASVAGAGLELWEHPPNGQGIIALMALGIIEQLEKQAKIPVFSAEEHNSAPYLHAIIEALRLAFTDGHWYVADPATGSSSVETLLSPSYLATRAALFSSDRAMGEVGRGDAAVGPSPALNASDTVYFSVVDSEGNAASFINSNYGGFGTHAVPAGCGFTLQDRGRGFSLMPGHPNAVAPRKRPYHTIIPGMVTYEGSGELHSVFGVMGGFMQPQGHVQTLLGQIVGDLGPQEALDAPRIRVVWEERWEDGQNDSTNMGGWKIEVEEGIADETVQALKELGHKVEVVTGAARALFGRGQIIKRTWDEAEDMAVWSAGSDMRGDGAAYPA